jgi:hypothetical protein
VAREVERLSRRRYPGELRLPNVAIITSVDSEAELKDRCRVVAHEPVLQNSPPKCCKSLSQLEKIGSIGSSTSPSATISPSCARDTALQHHSCRPALFAVKLMQSQEAVFASNTNIKLRRLVP